MLHCCKLGGASAAKRWRTSLNPGLESHQATKHFQPAGDCTTRTAIHFTLRAGFVLRGTKHRLRSANGATLRDCETTDRAEIGRPVHGIAMHCHRRPAESGLTLSYGADGQKLQGFNAQNLNSSYSLQSALQPQRQVLHYQNIHSLAMHHVANLGRQCLEGSGLGFFGFRGNVTVCCKKCLWFKSKNTWIPLGLGDDFSGVLVLLQSRASSRRLRP